MKMFIIVMAIVASQANAKTETEVVLDSVKIQTQNPKIETSFGADAENHNAWVVLEVSDSLRGGGLAGSDAVPPELVKVKMEGLMLDPETGNIVYENNQEKVICATAKSRVIGKSKFYKKSKNCQIHTSMNTRKKDDGFGMKKERYVDVVLDSMNN